MKRNFQNPISRVWFYFDGDELIRGRKLSKSELKQMNYENKVEELIKSLN